MGAAYVALDNRLPPRSFAVLGPPSSMRGELSGIDAAVADAPGEEDLTILTDSLTSIQASIQRAGLPRLPVRLPVRRALAQVETSHHQAILTERLTRQATSDEPGADLTDNRRGGRPVSLTAQWLLRPEQGRQYLGAAMAEMRHGAAKRRVMQTVAGLFPCQALLHRWGKDPSLQCLLCSGDTESVAHIQCWCPALKEARIAAHHAIAAHIMQDHCRCSRHIM
jgi:hypothetical protein